MNNIKFDIEKFKNKNIEMKEIDFVCENYNQLTLQPSFSENIFWDFVKLAKKYEVDITIHSERFERQFNSDFLFSVSGNYENVKQFLVKHYLGNQEVLFLDMKDFIEII